MTSATSKRARVQLRPRVVSDAALAEYLGKSISWLAGHRHELKAQGFPRRLPILGGNDLNAVDEWIDQLRAPAVTVDDAKLWQEMPRV